MTGASEASGWSALPIVLIAFPVVFVTLWVAIVWILSVLGGWSAVADRHAATGRPDGPTFGGVNAMFGLVSYSYVLTVVVATEGLYVETQRFFRIGHRPLLIPWSEIRDARKVTTLLGFDYVVFNVGAPRLARVRMSAKPFASAPIRLG